MKLISKVICATIIYGVSSAPTCLICEDGSVPQYSDTLLKFFPGTLPQTEYTCKELHFLGMYNDGNIITPEICSFLVKLASFSCGCRGGKIDQDASMSQQSETQTMDVTITGSSNDVILSSTLVTNKAINSTGTAPTISTNPTTAPSLSARSSVSDFPSSNPTMGTEGTLVPSLSPDSERHSDTSIELVSEDVNIDETVSDENNHEVPYYAMLMEIIQKLNIFLLNVEEDEKLNLLPSNYGKLRGM
jgi:hypothetical protein